MRLCIPIENNPGYTIVRHIRFFLWMSHVWWSYICDDEWFNLWLGLAISLYFGFNYFLCHPNFCEIRLWCLSFWSLHLFLATKIDFKGIYSLPKTLNGIVASLISVSIFDHLSSRKKKKKTSFSSLGSTFSLTNSLSTLGSL